MTVHPADEQRLAELLHQLRQLRRAISDARPMLASADDPLDDALASLEDGELLLNEARLAVLRALSEQDGIESGDLDRDAQGTVSPRPWSRYP